MSFSALALPGRFAGLHRPLGAPGFALAKYYVRIDWDSQKNKLCLKANEKAPAKAEAFSFGIRQRPTLPGRLQPSTIGAERLNFCVRYGNRWIPFAIVTGIFMRVCAVLRLPGFPCVYS